MSHTSLLEKIRTRQAVIGIFGLGYVGLPLAMRFAEESFPVIGFDIDEEKIASLQTGQSYLSSVTSKTINAAITNGFRATSDYSLAATADALIICVPTPLTKNRDPDLSFVTGTVERLLPNTKPHQVLVLESTTYPGTTDELIKPKLKNKNFKLGSDYFLGYSPEREDPGNTQYTTRNIPKIVSGSTAQCLETVKILYSAIIDTVVPVSSMKTAEMAKLLENIYRAVNIGLVNEMKIVADAMKINIHEVINAAATKPFGFTKFTPGPGLGGHCLPIDPFYLTWRAKGYGVNTRFIELAGEVNHSMPYWVIEKTIAALNSQKKALNGSRILILGLAYKKNVSDTRESPAAKIISLLSQRGAEVEYSDPHVTRAPAMREHSLKLSSLQLSSENLSSFDCVILITDHDEFDFQFITNHSKILIDTRGILSGENVVQA